MYYLQVKRYSPQRLHSLRGVHAIIYQKALYGKDCAGLPSALHVIGLVVGIEVI
jgi:hypothetical protein